MSNQGEMRNMKTELQERCLRSWKVALISSERNFVRDLGIEELQGNTHYKHHGLGYVTQTGCLHALSFPPGKVMMSSGRVHVLTGAAEALLPHTDQHVQAEIAVGRLVKVLESPHMLSIILHILHRMGEKQIPLNEINSRICKCQ